MPHLNSATWVRQTDTIKVESGHGSTVLSIVETVYEPCACSPVGKVKKVSLPYAPGGTVLWTEYVYDGLGRTLSVIQPNGAGTTTYLYEGNTVKVTSPSGKWKKYEMDGLGRLVKVFEPRPGGGTYETSYLYNPAGKLKQVVMPRDGVTQNRYFNYDTTAGTRLLSAQNPENGTVTYSYNSDGTVNFKTDAKGIKTEYSYDQHKRVSQMRKLPNGSTENRCERVDYFYDENGGTNNGRLTRMRWGWDASNQACTDPSTGFGIGFEEVYTYNAAGRTSTKTLNYAGTTLTAWWSYDNEGKLLTQAYPTRANHPGTNRTVDFTYDAMARLQRVRSSWDWNINTYQDVAANAGYNHMGALTSLSILGSTETRQYNALGQLTRITGLGIDLEYRFSATQNDGKITQQKNWVSGEEVTYLYDELERLSSAATTSTAWGLSWSYDGFGNRLAQNLTKGTGPTNSTLVDANTNRISGFGYQYDQNGNMTNMPQQNAQLTYDSSNRMTRFSNLDGAESYQYAPDNKRIWRSNGCSYYNWATGNTEPRPQIIFYSVFGQKLGEYCLTDNVTVIREYVYFGGRMVARSNGSNLEFFKTDRLHSNQDAPGGGFFPYGETKSGAATTGESFATYSRDWHGMDYADQRSFLSGAGRFLTSDPYLATSSGANQPSQPRTWNRYSYSANDPINHVDPKGLSFYGPSLEQEIDVWGLPWWMPFMPPPVLDPIANSYVGKGPNPEWQTELQVKLKVDAWDELIKKALIAAAAKVIAGEMTKYPFALKVAEDCYQLPPRSGDPVTRRRRYQIVDQNGVAFNPSGVTVAEHTYVQSGFLADGDGVWGPGKINSAGQFDDFISTLGGPDTVFFQQFTISVPWLGLSNMPIMVTDPAFEAGKQQFGTLGIKMERSVVFINGRDGKINGNLPKCTTPDITY